MTLDQTLELVSTLLQTVVIALLVFRKIYKTLPLFSSYLVWLFLAYGLGQILSKYPTAVYQRGFLAVSLVDSAFMFCVLVELSMSVLKPIRASLPRWTFLLIGGLFAILFAVVWHFARPSGVGQWNWATQNLIRSDIASSMMRIVFFLAVAGFSQLLSIGWRDRELQIATGLGFYALVGLSVTLLHMNQGADNPNQYHLLDEVASGSYIFSLAYWIMSFAQKVPERREFTPQMQNFLLAIAGQARSTRLAMTPSSEFKRDKNTH